MLRFAQLFKEVSGRNPTWLRSLLSRWGNLAGGSPTPSQAPRQLRFQPRDFGKQFWQRILAYSFAAITGEHDFVAFGVDAHGEVGWLSVLGLGFTRALTAGCSDFGGAFDDVGYLEGNTGPGLFAFASAVDGDDAAGDFDVGDMGVLFDDLSAEDVLVEGGGSIGICGPDGVFDFFDG